ncbi:hypothetical protein MOV08_26670 [Streptomyces yunnanensis]|uniref:DNA recombination-mediator protein A n=1 Tax=Streptomyces yunnanensis TaxID=156453 RepID=A0ABY8AEZ4_9ACTN|nr:hypothetical protein [Streptomyces yunnanensis]WEB42480.1 hypothetical protein MOV08_26670 [Streptomyces yunnanensis]
MTTIAVTGHMDLTDDTVPLVQEELRSLLREHRRELVGVTCLARGSDTLFAEAVVEAGGRLIVILPSQDYRQAKVKPDHAPSFDRLTAVAEVVTMPYDTANREAYEAANGELLKRADRLVAVWDGAAPSGKGGGTADTVEQARSAGVPVDVVWPSGARRGA